MTKEAPDIGLPADRLMLIARRLKALEGELQATGKSVEKIQSATRLALADISMILTASESLQEPGTAGVWKKNRVRSEIIAEDVSDENLGTGEDSKKLQEKLANTIFNLGTWIRRNCIEDICEITNIRVDPEYYRKHQFDDEEKLLTNIQVLVEKISVPT